MRVAVLVLVSSCGFSLPAGTGDAPAGDGGALIDESVPPDEPDAGPATCIDAWLAHTITFAAPTPLTQLNTNSFERDPFVSRDELIIYWSSGRPQSQGGADIWTATRPDRDAPFGGVARATEFSTSSGHEGKMAMTDDRLYAVVSSNRVGSSGVDVWETSRDSVSDPWPAELTRTNVTAVNTSNNEYDAFVTPDGLAIYLAPDSPGTQHIRVARRPTRTSAFGTPVSLSINGTNGDGDPTVFANERVIVFYSNRISATNDGSNIWYATRSSVNDPFGMPRELGINGDLNEGDPHVTADGCTIYFSRYDSPGVDHQLYTATATP